MNSERSVQEKLGSHDWIGHTSRRSFKPHQIMKEGTNEKRLNFVTIILQWTQMVTLYQRKLNACTVQISMMANKTIRNQRVDCEFNRR